ncbi:hypothetical protein ZIOFF_018143 [Zingiber officinale]|uniref:TCP domain-containing protein n=2 Tax=Zingiber officinale TaxID=94328 RepID=A0A8J5H724_ZINOF|nr:hypothetical protein ZIOFF_018143 [Zingiber officinale]
MYLAVQCTASVFCFSPLPGHYNVIADVLSMSQLGNGNGNGWRWFKALEVWWWILVIELCALDGQTFWKQEEQDEYKHQHRHRVSPVLRQEEEKKLQEGGGKEEKDLDPRRALRLQGPAGAKESEDSGKAQELQAPARPPLRGFQLQFHFNNQNYPSFWGSTSSSLAAATASSSEYACLPERMGEGDGLGYGQLSFLHHPPPRLPQTRSRCGSRVKGAAAGEIVEAQGGHVVRATGRKDRHSKVCTAKGPRERRVRLSAHTAIQFYDVQDRLGYDRPSKAVDWLIKNAKAAIDELAELPTWIPTATVAVASSHPPSNNQDAVTEDPADAATAFNLARGGGGGNVSTSFLPSSMDTDSIADTFKSFFPTAATPAVTSPPSSSSIGFLAYSSDLPPRASNQINDLRLSLQSFQDPILHNPEPAHHHGQYHYSSAHFLPSAQLAFEAAASASWAQQGRRIVPWNVVEASGGSAGYVFSFPPPQAVPLHSALGHNQLDSQRGPLQSTNARTVRAWASPIDAATDHQMQPPPMSSIGFASGAGFSGFRIPERFQGKGEHDGAAEKPPSCSS